jgi:lipopolysaccharide biosynthesis protein
MSHNSPTAVAFYLPQFHPIPENDAWWGTGFTEWTNVAKARPLFKGHEQPFLPSDLGFYDLRVPEAREQQANLAKEAGIGAFAYWHYWFGDGRRLLERPLKEVLDSGKPDFPFCLAWANETWSGRWHGLDEKILIRQVYGGVEDQRNFFYDSLPFFQDDRYAKHNGKLIFIVYRPHNLPNPSQYIQEWRELGIKEGLEFYLIGVGNSSCLTFGFDGFVSNGPSIPSELILRNYFEKGIAKIFQKKWQKMLWPLRPEIYDYQELVQNILNEPLDPGEHPLVIPNWDNTPRSGSRGLVLKNSTPDAFRIYLDKAVKRILETGEKRLIFIKSWNEWAEGNVLEPSRKWQKSYLDVCKSILR